MEDRIVPAAIDLWIAPASAIVPGMGGANYAADTNWSLGHSPAGGEIAQFDPSATQNGQQGTNTPCFVPANFIAPTLDSLVFKDWAGTLTLNSDLAANTVTINPRTTNAGNSEIIINSGSRLFALQTLTWAGGSVTGTGRFEVGGTDTINGTSTADKSTLGAAMDVGTYFNNNPVTGNLTFTQTTQPLVVNTNANIYVNLGSTLAFNEQAAQGQNFANAISKSDTLPHSIIVDGGTVSRSNVCQLYVGMGINIQSGGTLWVTNPEGQTSGNPLHFTGANPDGSGLESTGGYVLVYADVQSDNPGFFEGGDVDVDPDATLTLGVNATSPVSVEEGATITMKGQLVAHGGFSMYTGTFLTGGSTDATVVLDSGNQFLLNGGVIGVSDVNNNSAEGRLITESRINKGTIMLQRGCRLPR